jgi:ATP-dependent Clp protease ATP-binding subunit ClpC
MYERFTVAARKVMLLANQESQRYNHKYIGTEHMLLGLIREGSRAAFKVLGNLKVDLHKARLEIEKFVERGPDFVSGRVPLAPRTKMVIEHAIEEAIKLNHDYIDTEHLLLGLLREQEGVGAYVLMSLGLKLEDIRTKLQEFLPTPIR